MSAQSAAVKPAMDQALRSIEQWRSQGRLVEVEGRAIFAVEAGDGPRTVLILHGFPGSSFDWRRVIPLLAPHARVVAFDFLGFGLSDKPLDARYSLFEQADLAERLAGTVGIERCLLVAHDMGDTVAAELLGRSQEGRLELEVEGVVLTNGSIFPEQAELPPGQRFLLAMPDEPLPMPLPLEALLPGLAATFSIEHEPSLEDLEAMVWLVGHREGDRLLPRLIRHVEERRRNQNRWTAGLVDFTGPMTALWGEQDPTAAPEVARRLAELRPATEVQTWADVGHWPALEVPDRVAEAIVDRLGR
jgi:pimeloyl-ACP methyl ester carboxylesterase